VSDFRHPEKSKETTMTNHKTLAGESGYSNPFALIVAAIAICTMTAGAAVFAPAGATSGISTSTAYADPNDDFPTQFVNQPEQVVMMMEMMYD
jgi:hypothetical protein